MYSTHTLFHEGCAYLQTHTNYPRGEQEALVSQLLAWQFGFKRIDILVKKEFHATEEAITLWYSYLARLAQYEPLQYITQTVEFGDITLLVSPDVLIPRPETAEWVQRLITYCQTLNFEPTQIIDLCTGSGCIAITLALAYPQARTEAWDISHDALSIAQKNADTWKVPIAFFEGDILTKDIPISTTERVLLVSNPPYIPQREASQMQANVLDYEPSMALFVPDNAPLLFYKRLAEIAEKIQPQIAVFEIHENFSEAVMDLCAEIGFTNTTVWQDFHGKDRCVVGTNNTKQA